MLKRKKTQVTKKFVYYVLIKKGGKSELFSFLGARSLLYYILIK